MKTSYFYTTQHEIKPQDPASAFSLLRAYPVAQSYDSYLLRIEDAKLRPNLHRQDFYYTYKPDGAPLTFQELNPKIILPINGRYVASEEFTQMWLQGVSLQEAASQFGIYDKETHSNGDVSYWFRTLNPRNHMRFIPRFGWVSQKQEEFWSNNVVKTWQLRHLPADKNIDKFPGFCSDEYCRTHFPEQLAFMHEILAKPQWAPLRGIHDSSLIDIFMNAHRHCCKTKSPHFFEHPPKPDIQNTADYIEYDKFPHLLRIVQWRGGTWAKDYFENMYKNINLSKGD